MIESLSCLGFRSFSIKQTLNLAVPNGKPGSGLTVLVGPNGGGKSTLVECFNKISLANRGASFSRGKRNLSAGNVVEIVIHDDNGGAGVLKTIRGGSETSWEGLTLPSIYYLPSRRFFNPFFPKTRWSRDFYLNNPQNYQQRTNSLDTYTYRLIDLNSGNSSQFNEMLGRVLGYELIWAIDQDDNGMYFVNITGKQGHHNSDGLGEGVLSIMFIVDALSGNKDELIVIDEPELSLHPQLQLRLMREILEKSRQSQIVIATHSPNMLSLDSIVNGGMVARVYESKNGSKICMIDDESRSFIKSQMNNFYNPHVLGTDSRACFFADDGLIISEGQEDVMMYPLVLRELGLSYSIPFFGFGAGGASVIVNIAHLLNKLGFEKVGAIYDGDMKDEYQKFLSKFNKSGYKAWIIPADDVRDKDINESHKKIGLLSSKNELKSEYSDQLLVIFKEIDSYLKENK